MLQSSQLDRASFQRLTGHLYQFEDIVESKASCTQASLVAACWFRAICLRLQCSFEGIERRTGRAARDEDLTAAHRSTPFESKYVDQSNSRSAMLLAFCPETSGRGLLLGDQNCLKTIKPVSAKQ